MKNATFTSVTQHTHNNSSHESGSLCVTGVQKSNPAFIFQMENVKFTTLTQPLTWRWALECGIHLHVRSCYVIVVMMLCINQISLHNPSVACIPRGICGDLVIAFTAASISTFYLRIMEEHALYIALESHAQNIAQIGGWLTYLRSMATKPGILTDWPWKPLGSFKVLDMLAVYGQVWCTNY